jgi:hypothetical protein
MLDVIPMMISKGSVEAEKNKEKRIHCIIGHK